MLRSSSGRDELCLRASCRNPGGDTGGLDKTVSFGNEKEGTRRGSAEVLKHQPDWDGDGEEGSGMTPRPLAWMTRCYC